MPVLGRLQPSAPASSQGHGRRASIRMPATSKIRTSRTGSNSTGDGPAEILSIFGRPRERMTLRAFPCRTIPDQSQGEPGPPGAVRLLGWLGRPRLRSAPLVAAGAHVVAPNVSPGDDGQDDEDEGAVVHVRGRHCIQGAGDCFR